MLALIAAAAASVSPIMVEPAARPAAAEVDRFHAALGKGDGKTALQLMAQDALVYESGHVERGKAEYAATHLGADMQFAQAVKSLLTRRNGRASGNLAWIASEGRTSGTFKGRAVDRATTETIVLRRAAGQWSIVHIHWSSATP